MMYKKKYFYDEDVALMRSLVMLTVAEVFDETPSNLVKRCKAEPLTPIITSGCKHYVSKLHCGTD